MTTVSKPKRNPARAEVMDQKNKRVFMGGSSGAVGEREKVCASRRNFGIELSKALKKSCHDRHDIWS
jgi:hypothetical protein